MVGRFVDVVVGSNEVLVSVYDETFGDLVVAHYTTQADLKWFFYVDGVLVIGTLGGDSSGSCRGIVTPGPDVGQYTSMVVNGRGEPRVAYYDKDNGDLRVALFNLEAGGWAVHVVDPERDAGRYTSMVIDPVIELLRVSYMVNDLSSGGHAVSAVRLVIFWVPQPQSAADWSIVTVESVEVRDFCDDACSSGQSCVLVDGVLACRSSIVNCQPQCASGQACVQDDGAPACLATLPPDLAGLPRGIGLFTDLAHTASDDVLVYYDSLRGDLRGVRIGTSGPQMPVTIDGDGFDGRQGGDVGRFAALAYDSTGSTLGIV